MCFGPVFLNECYRFAVILSLPLKINEFVEKKINRGGVLAM